MAGYRDLQVWKSAMRFSLAVYRSTGPFPDDERFGLVSQLRRAAVSVPSNIAEGHGRNSPAEMIRFSSIALGSLAEVETQLYLARELGYLDRSECDTLLAQSEGIGRMLHGLIRSNRDRQQ